MSTTEYPFRVYTLAEVWDAFEAGAKEARANGGAPSDDLIRKSADAYCKLVYHSDPLPDLPGGTADG
jgi:hypothetical protein